MNERVVLVEDDTGIAEVETLALQDAGYIVIVASAEVAIELATSPIVPVDCLVLDLILPDIDGSTVLQRINGAVPVVLCTAVPAVEIERAARRLGVDSIVEKPFVLRDLTDAVKRAIASRERE